MVEDVFGFVDSILENKKNEMNSPEDEKLYDAFIVNRAMSNHVDTIIYGQEMNLNSHLEKNLQYDFLRHSIRPAKRWAKWPKKKQNENIDVIRKYYGYNFVKAKSVSTILTEDQIKQLKKLVYPE